MALKFISNETVAILYPQENQFLDHLLWIIRKALENNNNKTKNSYHTMG